MEISNHSPPPLPAAPLDYHTERTISWKPVRKALALSFILVGARWGGYFVTGMQNGQRLQINSEWRSLLNQVAFWLEAIIFLSALVAGVMFVLESRKRKLVALIPLGTLLLFEAINVVMAYSYYIRNPGSMNQVHFLASMSGEIAIVIALGAAVYFDHRVGQRTELQPV